MENLTLTPRYSTLTSRTLAFLIDAVVGGLLGVIAGHIIPVLGAVLLWFFYGPILESSEARATIGKYLMGIQVADMNGARISLKAAVIRNLLKIVSVMFLFIGFVFALFGSRKQTLHDLIADTTVVDGKTSVPLADAWLASTKELFRSGRSSLEEFAPSTPNATNETLVTQLERLQALRTQGALTEDEYQIAKAKILQ